MAYDFEDDPMADLIAAYDYKVEAYGDRCSCGTLRWGGDCPNCMRQEDEMVLSPDFDEELGTALASRFEPEAPSDAPKIDDDDIPF